MISLYVRTAEGPCVGPHIQELIIVRIMGLLEELVVVRIKRRGGSLMAAAVRKYGLSPSVLFQAVHKHLHKLGFVVHRTASLVLVTRSLVTRTIS